MGSLGCQVLEQPSSSQEGIAVPERHRLPPLPRGEALLYHPLSVAGLPFGMSLNSGSLMDVLTALKGAPSPGNSVLDLEGGSRSLTAPDPPIECRRDSLRTFQTQAPTDCDYSMDT